MNASLDDQIKNAVSLLLNCRRSSKDNILRIKGEILEENGLNNKNFWNIICPMLEKEAGVKFSSHPDIEVVNETKHNRAWNRLNELARDFHLIERSKEMYGDLTSYEEEKEKYLIQKRKNLWNEMEESSVTHYVFTVDLQKLELFQNKHTGLPENMQMDNSVDSSVQFFDDERKEKSNYFININGEGKLILNNQFVLSKPVYGSENYIFIDFCLNKGDRFGITMSNMTRELKRDSAFKKSPHSILDDLKFRPEIKKIFFPHSTRNAIEFRNYLTQEEFNNLKINNKKLQSELKKLKKLNKK